MVKLKNATEPSKAFCVEQNFVSRIWWCEERCSIDELCMPMLQNNQLFTWQRTRRFTVKTKSSWVRCAPIKQRIDVNISQMMKEIAKNG